MAPSPTVAPVGSPTATPDKRLRPPAVNGPLGPAPTNCPTSSTLQTYSPNNFGGGFSSPISFLGASPVWQLGLGDASSPIALYWDSSQPWPSTKVMWVVGPNYNQPVTLTGQDVRSGTPLWFQVYPSNAIPTSDPNADSSYTTHAVLDPTAPNRGATENSTGHWGIWGIGLIALAAGCYELDATWAEGSWSAIYAFGGA
ncbi:MAG TPA: hypothetical protein VH540_09150 [Ktedonobacterales bacterium]